MYRAQQKQKNKTKNNSKKKKKTENRENQARESLPLSSPRRLSLITREEVALGTHDIVSKRFWLRFIAN